MPRAGPHVGWGHGFPKIADSLELIEAGVVTREKGLAGLRDLKSSRSEIYEGMLSSRVIGRSSQSGPLQGVVTLGTIGQMALFFSSLKCQHYYDSGQPSAPSVHGAHATRDGVDTQEIICIHIYTPAGGALGWESA